VAVAAKTCVLVYIDDFLKIKQKRSPSAQKQTESMGNKPKPRHAKARARPSLGMLVLGGVVCTLTVIAVQYYLTPATIEHSMEQMPGAIRRRASAASRSSSAASRFGGGGLLDERSKHASLEWTSLPRDMKACLEARPHTLRLTLSLSPHCSSLAVFSCCFLLLFSPAVFPAVFPACFSYMDTLTHSPPPSSSLSPPLSLSLSLDTRVFLCWIFFFFFFSFSQAQEELMTVPGILFLHHPFLPYVAPHFSHISHLVFLFFSLQWNGRGFTLYALRPSRRER